MSLNTTLPAFVAGTVVPASQLNALGNALNGIQAGWDVWTPSLTGFTVGSNGQLVARYLQIGKTIQFRVTFVAGSASTFSGALNIGLPFAPRGDYGTGVDCIGSALLSRSTSASRTVATAYLGGSSTCGLIVDGHDATNGYTATRLVGSTVPWTWGAGDTFGISGTYEIA